MEGKEGVMIIIVLFATFWAALLIWGYYAEKHDFNNNKCPDCNIEWRNFDMDSQGGRGYTCDKCDKTIWISWLRVDKDCG